MKSLYLDYSATTPLAEEVISEITSNFEHFGNPSSSHPYGWYMEEKVSLARGKIAKALGCASENIVLTSGATEANNLALKGVAKLHSSAHLISVATEHRSILDPLYSLGQDSCDLSILEVNELGQIDLNRLEESISNKSRLLSVMLANNEIGTIHPVSKIAEICKRKNVLLHCDATQGLGRLPIDVDKLGVDLLSISAHKCYGPKGIGALYVRPGVVLKPLIEGGGHEGGLRSGTLNTLGIIAFGVAAQLAHESQEQDALRMQELSSLLFKELQRQLPEVVLNGPQERLPGSLNVSLMGVSNERLLAKLQTKLAFSLASACQSAKKDPSHVLAALGLPKTRVSSAIRLSLGRPSTRQDVVSAAEILANGALKVLNSGK